MQGTAIVLEKIEVERWGAVTILRLNDPKVLNAVTTQMVEELDQAIDSTMAGTRAFILTGAGRAFCSGANLTAPEEVPAGGEPDAGATLESHANPLMLRLRTLPVPWITAVRGPAAGMGCSLALAADFVLASETAYFLQAFIRIGLIPDCGSSFMLARGISRVRAMEMMMLGDRVPAQQAFEWGLINRVVADQELDATALDLARRLAAGPTRSYGLIRSLIWDALEASYEATLRCERELQREAGLTRDAGEGRAAFIEKRTPDFLGY